MLFFFICVALLVLGYFTYGVLVEKVFGINPARPTPANAMADGVDYVEMSTPKVFLVQLLNIAGLGPVFGPILGALYGPSALLWIVIGSIFAGAVHDYFSGMLSVRHGGESVPAVVGRELGPVFRQIMNYFSVILLLLVGVVFVTGPAGLMVNITGWDKLIWIAIIFVYYFLATVLPIDKIIGRLYPFFGALLLFMTFGLMTALIVSPDHHFFPGGLDFAPAKANMWPLMFITIACGAVSGFHATQSPLMARCMRNEKNGRFVFYGAMIAEGVIALIWATLGLSFYDGGVTGLAGALGDKMNSALVVDQVSRGLLGNFGGVLAILGVVILPITSGDTAFRAARLIIAEYIKLPQIKPIRRLWVAVPLFVIGIALSTVNFGIIWRYFGWANQTLAMIMLWAAAAWLARHGKFYWLAAVPATFMTAVSATYILEDQIGFRLSPEFSIPTGIVCAVLAFAAFFIFIARKAPMPDEPMAAE
jgi:carbon starvation protein CstA